MNDKQFVSCLLKHAEEIFEAAQSGEQDCDFSILIHSNGGIHMLAGSDWSLEPLRIHHGAQAVYRVKRSGGRVRLEARSADESCTLEAAPPATRLSWPAPALAADFPRYLTIN